jgi:rRNA maturation RNase YbeY
VAIFFFNEDLDFTLEDESSTTSWIQNIIYDEGYHDENINYIFCSDNFLLDLNKEYLGHDTLTDIITFDNSEEESHIEADIFISIERIQENADQLSKSFSDELHRVIIHGLLHIMGYSDKTEEDKLAMREKEDACLSLR